MMIRFGARSLLSDGRRGRMWLPSRPYSPPKLRLSVFRFQFSFMRNERRSEFFPANKPRTNKKRRELANSLSLSLLASGVQYSQGGNHSQGGCCAMLIALQANQVGVSGFLPTFVGAAAATTTSAPRGELSASAMMDILGANRTGRLVCAGLAAVEDKRLCCLCLSACP